MLPLMAFTDSMLSSEYDPVTEHDFEESRNRRTRGLLQTRCGLAERFPARLAVKC